MDINYISKLKQILAAESLTQEELAKKLGVTFAALNRWLNERACPHQKKVDRIDRLHREILGYASMTEEDIRRIVVEANKYKGKKIWQAIANSKNLQDDLILEHTYNSTTIEGTTFSKKETEAVIFDKLNIKDKSLLEHFDVINYSTVLRKILKGEFPAKITEDTINEKIVSVKK